MARIDPFGYRYTLFLLDSDEQRITGLVSIHDLERTKRLALSILNFDARVAFVAIHHYAPHVAAHEEPVARVSLDDEL